MSRLVLTALVLAAALVQVGAVPTLFLDASAAPLLPVALLAAWGSMRNTDELWPALLVAPLPLALASEERLGWFVIALLPIAAILVLRDPAPESGEALARAPLTAAAGGLAYLIVLWVAGGQATGIPAASGALAASALLTALLATLFALMLWPLRQRRAAGLYG